MHELAQALHAAKLSTCGAPSSPSDARPSPAGAPWGRTGTQATQLPSSAPFLSPVLPSGSVKEINSSVRLNGM